MAARRKAPGRKAAPKRKTATRKVTSRAKTAPRELPNDEAWRELVETAIEKPDPDGVAAPRRKKR